MKYFIIRDGKTIKHVEPIGHNFTAEDVLVLDEMPEYIPQQGKIAKLLYSEVEGVHYEYTDIPVNADEISDEEALNIILGGDK